MTSELPEPATESLGAAIIELDRTRLPWPARWLLRDGTRAYSLIADQVARRVESRVVARVREETTDQVNASWERALTEQADAEAVEAEPLPAFNSVAQCRKCGHVTDPATRTHGYRWPVNGSPEAMQRQCPMCGFSWLERPLDAPQPQNGPQGDETAPGDAVDAEGAGDAHSAPEGTGTGPRAAERADDGDPDSPGSPQSHAQAPGRENTRDDGPEPGSVALVPAVTASGGFGDGNPDAKAADR